ncbi:MAG: S8 family peptidase [Myxococcaceae bacterium]
MRAVVVGVLGCTLLACSLGPKHAKHTRDGDASAGRVPGRVVVDFRDGTSAAVLAERGTSWGVSLRFNSLVGPQDGVAVIDGVEDVDSLLHAIRQSPDVEFAEPLLTYQAQAWTPNDPLYAKQWNLKLIGMPEAWEVSHGKGVTVAVLDTGVAYETRGPFVRVPDLQGVRFAPGYDFVNDTEHPNDDNGHGTHVAGTIAQATNNGEGVAGIAFEATLMPIKVLDAAGTGNSADIADGIRWAVDHGAKVLNLSLGGFGYSRVIENAVAYARRHGAVVVAAAGNHGDGTVAYPAAYAGAVGVGAVGPDGARAPYSAWGEQLDLLAPGGDKRQGEEGGILQATIAKGAPGKPLYAFYQGTSMATPHVAGVAALLFAAGAKTPDEVERALYAGASGAGGWDAQRGHGLLDAAGALRALGATTPVDWQPLAASVAILILLLLSLNPKVRPGGVLNVLLDPKLLVPLLLSSVGFFVLRVIWHKWVGTPSATVDVLSLPLPDWERIVFGRGRLAHPLFYSVLPPLLLALPAAAWKGFRPVAAGIALGFAGFLAYAAWTRAPGLSWLPFQALALPWLVANAVACAVLARALLAKRETR